MACRTANLNPNIKTSLLGVHALFVEVGDCGGCVLEGDPGRMSLWGHTGSLESRWLVLGLQLRGGCSPCWASARHCRSHLENQLWGVLLHLSLTLSLPLLHPHGRLGLPLPEDLRAPPRASHPWAPLKVAAAPLASNSEPRLLSPQGSRC